MKDIPNKIIILGNGGTGKSTLGEKLSTMLDIPVYHLDQLTFQTGWIAIGEKEFISKLKNILHKEKWIVEGWSFNSTIPMRIEASDLIIYLDFNIWICYWYAFTRHLKYSFKQNPYDPPNSNIWRKTIRMVKAMWRVHKIYEPKLKKIIPAYPHKKFLVFYKRSEVNNFLKNII